VLKTHQDLKGEVWFNELRIADMDNQGGMAAILSVDSTDFATTATRKYYCFFVWNRDQTKEAVKIFNNIIS
jgi:hypothetical protein